MSEYVKKYIMISGTILLLLICLGICWLFNFMFEFVYIFSYLIGFGNGMLIFGVLNSDD